MSPILTRRQALSLAGAAALSLAAPALAAGPARVVIVGAGFGGATCARVLRRIAPEIEVTLIERDPAFVTCPFSNLVIAGFAEMASVTHSYDGLRAAGINVVIDTVTGIDATARKVATAGGGFQYDRLVVSPGISLRFDAIPGYDAAAAEKLPHAWQAGPQTALLRDQVHAMEDGGTVLIVVPDLPYRCPPGPYERASLIAARLKAAKPKSRLIVIDAKDSFAKQALFQEGWAALYPDQIRWVSFSDNGGVLNIDPGAMTVETAFETFTGDVINVIPPQRAGQLAQDAGLTGNDDWCAIDATSFESAHLPGVHVLGDATLAGDMPKSGTAASSQARVCAHAVAALLAGQAPAQPTLINTCYSFLAPDYGISVTEVFRPDETGAIRTLVQELSPQGGSAERHAQEADYARGWYQSITTDMFG